MQCNGVLNVICPDRISPVAKEIFAELPLPDDPDAVFNNTRARNNGSRTPGAWQGVYSIKGDHIVTDKLRVSGMFSQPVLRQLSAGRADPRPAGRSLPGVRPRPLLALQRRLRRSARTC